MDRNQFQSISVSFISTCANDLCLGTALKNRTV